MTRSAKRGVISWSRPLNRPDATTKWTPCNVCRFACVVCQAPIPPHAVGRLAECTVVTAPYGRAYFDLRKQYFREAVNRQRSSLDTTVRRALKKDEFRAVLNQLGSDSSSTPPYPPPSAPFLASDIFPTGGCHTVPHRP